MDDEKKKKPGLGALVLSLGKSKDDDGDDESSEETSEVAGEVLAAIKADDASALEESLRAFVMSCKH